MNLVGFDTETYLIGAGAVCPPIVCAQFAWRGQDGKMNSFGRSTGDGDEIYNTIKELLEDQEVHLIGQRICFDMGVICNMWEDLLPLVFQAYEDERIHDLSCREKCLNLSDYGKIATVPVPSGKPRKVFYSMEALAMKYLGLDLSTEKNDPGSWRLHYSDLDGIPFDEFPQEASYYALEDAEHNVEIFEAQEKRVENIEGPVSLQTAIFHSGVDFALYLITQAGFPIDAEARQKVVEMVTEELAPEKMVKLLRSEILRCGNSARPYKSKAQRALAAEALGQKVEDVESRNDFSEEEVEIMVEAGVKLTKPVKQSINTKLLRALVEATWAIVGQDPVMTGPSDTRPDGQISCAAEVLLEIVDFDESGIIEEYAHRAKLQKIVNTELPRMLNPATGDVAARVHPDFDVMKETSRTSSYGGNLYPSFNCQNVDPRVRQCFVADEDHVLCSSDYNSVDLVSAAQEQLDHFGTSALADIINEGKDPHGYLGAQLAYHLHDHFRMTCKEKKAKTAEEVYKRFMECKTHKDREVKAFFKHWRTFAKPTGLGYPGGLGAKTFVTYAKGSFGVSVTLDQAKQLKEIWLATFPEFKLFFDFIVSERIDPVNHRYSDEGKMQTSYAYLSPLGTYRANCTFCQIANGMALQTRTAEGAKKGVFDLLREQFDHTRESILYGTQTLAFIHDENITHLERHDRQLRHDQALAATQRMADSMQPFMPDVEVRAEPALMLRWDKRAEAVYGDDGLLDIWTPETA